MEKYQTECGRRRNSTDLKYNVLAMLLRAIILKEGASYTDAILPYLIKTLLAEILG